MRPPRLQIGSPTDHRGNQERIHVPFAGLGQNQRREGERIRQPPQRHGDCLAGGRQARHHFRTLNREPVLAGITESQRQGAERPGIGSVAFSSRDQAVMAAGRRPMVKSDWPRRKSGSSRRAESRVNEPSPAQELSQVARESVSMARSASAGSLVVCRLNMTWSSPFNRAAARRP